MNATLLKSLVASLPVAMLLLGSIALFLRSNTTGALLQFIGAGCFAVVVLTHICEALHFFPWMHWGLEVSIGHYLDLGSAIAGGMLFPAGYLLYAKFKL